MLSRPLLQRSAATTLARLATVAMLLSVMAIGSRHLNAEQFGLWAIIYTVMNFMPTLDFGFRSSLGNRLAALKSDPEASLRQRDHFVAVFHLELVIALVGGALLVIGLSAINWGAAFRLSDPIFAREVQHLFPLLCGLMMLNQPLSLASTALFADQRIELASLVAVGQAVVLVAAFWLGTYTASFTGLMLSFFGCAIGYGVMVTALLLRKMGWRWGWPVFSEQAAMVRSLAAPSWHFFVLSFCAMSATVVGPLYAGTIAGGAAAGGDFTLLQRLFSLLLTVHLAALAPLAPAYTSHARQGNWSWVQDRLNFCVRLIWPALFLGGAALILVAHPLLLRIWTGRWLTDFPLAGLLALGAVLAGWANTFSILLNSLGAVRSQAMLSMIMLAPVIVLPALLGHQYGLRGVALANALCALPACLVCWWFAQRAIRTQYLRA